MPITASLESHRGSLRLSNWISISLTRVAWLFMASPALARLALTLNTFVLTSPATTLHGAFSPPPKSLAW